MSIRNELGFINVHPVWQGDREELDHRMNQLGIRFLNHGQVKSRDIDSDSIDSLAAISESKAPYLYALDPPSPLSGNSKEYGVIYLKSEEILITQETHEQIQTLINNKNKGEN